REKINALRAIIYKARRASKKVASLIGLFFHFFACFFICKFAIKTRIHPHGLSAKNAFLR
ncbi:MAG TPA: hypothetical protein PKL42_06160, partial [Methylotenera sp.]|nr:hypothetical protein [Methylotenera sp.]